MAGYFFTDNKDLALVYGCAVRYMVQVPDTSAYNTEFLRMLRHDMGYFDDKSMAVLLRDVQEAHEYSTNSVCSRLLTVISQPEKPKKGINMQEQTPVITSKHALVMKLAVHYCLGRMTYMPTTVQRFVSTHIEVVKTSDVQGILQIIEDYKRSGASLGMDIDVLDWQRFEAFLQRTIRERAAAENRV